jgi:hypothetical protein
LLQASFESSTGFLTLLFDQELQAPTPGNWAPGTFTVRVAPSTYETDDVQQVSPTEIEVHVALLDTWPGFPNCDYDDSMSTIVGTNGLSVASWIDFPVSIT